MILKFKKSEYLPLTQLIIQSSSVKKWYLVIPGWTSSADQTHNPEVVSGGSWVNIHMAQQWLLALHLWSDW